MYAEKLMCLFIFVKEKGIEIMKINNRSQSIKDGLHKGFATGESKMANRKCYGYDAAPDGTLVINPEEAKQVQWIFKRYLSGDSLGKIATGLERRGIPSPTGRPKWNREAIDKLLSNEKYTGSVLLQKTVSICGSQFQNNGELAKVLIKNHHDAIISIENFEKVQQLKKERSKAPVQGFSMKLSIRQ